MKLCYFRLLLRQSVRYSWGLYNASTGDGSIILVAVLSVADANHQHCYCCLLCLLSWPLSFINFHQFSLAFTSVYPLISASLVSFSFLCLLLYTLAVLCMYALYVQLLIESLFLAHFFRTTNSCSLQMCPSSRSSSKFV